MNTCSECRFYKHPKKILEYPNCDNEALGWRKCRQGSVIKAKSMACQFFNDGTNKKELLIVRRKK